MAHKLKVFEAMDAALGARVIADRLNDQARRTFLAAARARDYQETINLKQQGFALQSEAALYHRLADKAEAGKSC